MAGMAERLAVADVVPQVGMLGPCLDVVGVKSVTRPASLASVVVSLEHAIAERDVSGVRVVLLPDEGTTTAPVRVRTSRQDGGLLAEALHGRARLATVFLRGHTPFQRSRDVGLLLIGKRAARCGLTTSCRSDLRSRLWRRRGIAHVLVDPASSARPAAETLVVALRDRFSAFFAYASHFYPNLTCC